MGARLQIRLPRARLLRAACSVHRRRGPNAARPAVRCRGAPLPLPRRLRSARTGGTTAGGTTAGGTTAGGTTAGGTTAGGTTASGTIAGGTTAGGTIAGGTIAGGTIVTIRGRGLRPVEQEDTYVSSLPQRRDHVV